MKLEIFCAEIFTKNPKFHWIFNENFKKSEFSKKSQNRKFPIYFSLQNVQNIPFMTVLDNILLGSHSRIDTKATVQRWISQDQREIEEAMVLDIMDFLGIANYEQKYMVGQPFGIQKLAEIARALVSKPKLILLDEPAAGMNDQETREIANIIREIKEDLGITVLLVEHDMNLVMSISDRICVLDSGEIIAIGEPKEIKNHPKVIEIYLGETADA